MRNYIALFILFAFGAFLSACSLETNEDVGDENARVEDVYGGDIVTQELSDCDTLPHDANVPCRQKDGAVCLPRSQKLVAVNGVPYCPPHERCGDTRLPPQPCAQPMPEYYGNVSEAAIEDGVVLIHPYTRTKIICFDRPTQSAQDCALDFQAAGYVLITDLPQLPARYDFLRDGTYPTRRWRGGGEVVPRW